MCSLFLFHEFRYAVCGDTDLFLVADKSLSVAILLAVYTKAGMISALDYNLFIFLRQIRYIVFIFFPIQDSILTAIYAQRINSA